MGIISGTCEQRLNEADEKILMLTGVNDNLAAIAGELRNEIISLREELVTKRELISSLRSMTMWENLNKVGPAQAVREIRTALGVRY